MAPDPSRSATLLGGVVLLALIPLLAVTSLQLKSATFDEPIHLVYGLHYLESGDLAVGVDTPPLARLIAAASVRMARVPINYSPSDLAWTPAFLAPACQKVLYLQNDADRLLFWGRISFVCLHLLLAAVAVYWSLQLWGRGGAFCTLALCALSPTLLAHSRLVATDLPLATFLFLSLFSLSRGSHRLLIVHCLGAGISLGLALLTKHSAVACVPMLAAVLVTRAVLPAPWSVKLPFSRRGWTLARRGGRLLLALAALGGICAVALLVIWMCYGFQAGSWSDQDRLAEKKAAVQLAFRSEQVLEAPALESGLRLAERLRVLPEPYLLGLRFALKHIERRLSFFMGERSIDGSFWYFPVAFALKTPLGFFVVFGLALWGMFRGADPSRLVAYPFLLLLPILYFGTSLLANINLGQRHLLPIYPFLFVIAGASWPAMSRSLGGRLVVVAALLWFALRSFASYPDYLTHFNEIAGGPRGGMRYLGDSNLDWGQDLKRLRPWMEAHRVRHVKLGYFGTALPQYYGFSFEWLPSVGFLNDQAGSRTVREGDYLAVSATCLQGFYFDDMDLYGFLEDFQPIDNIGHSIYIYHITKERLSPPASPTR